MFTTTFKSTFSNEEVIAWRNEFDAIYNGIKNANVDNCKNVRGRYGTFCPYLQFITMDALNKEDYPNGIADNSIYLTFTINLLEKKIEIHSCGHVWISKEDKEKYPMDKYLAMHSMLQITKRNGGKVMRKSKFKNVDDAVAKMKKAFTDVMTQVIDYTNGYPYERGVKALKTA